MVRAIVFLVAIGLTALGAAWIADQAGQATLVFNGWRVETSFPVFVLAMIAFVVAVMMLWAAFREIWRLPRRLREAFRNRQERLGRNAITSGLIAIGAGDRKAAERYARLARRHAANDPLALLLNAQEAQLSGDRAGAERAFEALASREDTRLLGLHGLFVEAQRSDDPVRAVALAEATLKSAPNSVWASQAVLGFRCARSDWAGALAILDSNYQEGLIDAASFRRQRAVLLAAQAMEAEATDRDQARDLANEAVKLAPTLIPAVTLAAKFMSESHQVRKAMRMIEAAWREQPHPDLADAYAHVRIGDAATERLARIESLVKMSPEGEDAKRESALALARAAMDAQLFDRARAALVPFTSAPTQRVAMLMAEIERTDGGDSGRARQWTQRAVHARHDPVWTADGYVSDRWRPVSPVTGRIDAFKWMTPVAALPPSETVHTEGRDLVGSAEDGAPPAIVHELSAAPSKEVPPPNSPDVAEVAKDDAVSSHDRSEPSGESPAKSVDTSPAAPVPPVFRPRRDLDPSKAPPIPAVIPMVRAPDDPGVGDEEIDEPTYEAGDENAQVGGWRGFLSRVTR